MRHRVKKNKLNRDRDTRRALSYALARSILLADSIKTTTPKAKFIKPVVEKLVTKAKAGDSLETRRYLLSRLRNNSELVDKLIKEIAVSYKKRNGGYLRILKSHYRPGDNAEVSVLSWVEKDKKEETAKPKETNSKTAKESSKEKKVVTKKTTSKPKPKKVKKETK